METTTEQTVTRSQSVINRSAVKAYALKVSKDLKCGKFTRVGECFLDQVEAEVESAIRGLSLSSSSAWEAPKPEDDRTFVTGAAVDKLMEKLHEKAKNIIAGKVMRHPSIGCTLKA